MTFAGTMVLMCAALSISTAQTPGHHEVPVSRPGDARDTLHGVAIPDPYRWLEDQNSTETRAWIGAQNAYADSFLQNLPSRSPLEKRLGELTRVEEVGIPAERGGRYFYLKRRPSDEQSILYVREGLTGRESVFLDPNPLSTDHTISADFLELSRDGSLAAYLLRHGGDDRAAVRIRDLRTNQDIPDSLPNNFIEGLSFKRDNSGFYYVVLTPLVGRRVLYHAMGTPFDRDTTIFGRGYGPETGFGATVSENGRFLLITVYHGWAQNDIFIQDISSGGPLRPVVTDTAAVFDARFAGDRLLVLTDWNAPQKRIMEVDLTATNPVHWKEIVPAGDRPIEEFSLVGGKLFVRYLKDAISQIRVFTPDGATAGEISLPGAGTATVPYGNWESNEGFFQYSSYTFPNSTYRYEIPTGKTALWSRPSVPFDPGEFETRAVWYRSKDGTNVPMFLVHKKGLVMDGARPVLLTGYGGFNISMVPYFSSDAVVWAEHGGVFALPNLRGGGEFGRTWHESGMQGRKQNVFDDFIAAAEWLVTSRVTTPHNIGIEGMSNGGLLVGAALTQRPDLFKAVVCEYPLLDMVRFHMFLQGPQWVPEYGSSVNADQFKTLFAYSPYHRVRGGVKYPATLLVTGDADTRVAPLHARKMAALLQSVAGPDNPVLLHYETETGHSAGASASKQIESRARALSFLFWQLGIRTR